MFFPAQPYQTPVTLIYAKRARGAYQRKCRKRVNRYIKESPKTLDTRQFGESYQRTRHALSKMVQESASDVENKEKIPLFPLVPIEFG